MGGFGFGHLVRGINALTWPGWFWHVVASSPIKAVGLPPSLFVDVGRFVLRSDCPSRHVQQIRADIAVATTSRSENSSSSGQLNPKRPIPMSVAIPGQQQLHQAQNRPLSRKYTWESGRGTMAGHALTQRRGTVDGYRGLSLEMYRCILCMYVRTHVACKYVCIHVCSV